MDTGEHAEVVAAMLAELEEAERLLTALHGKAMELGDDEIIEFAAPFEFVQRQVSGPCCDVALEQFVADLAAAVSLPAVQSLRLGERQVAGARVGLTSNMGMWSSCIHVLSV